jgi:hypothetical protein
VADEVERLLGLPLDEFTSARNEAAKRLRKEGRGDEAAEVAELRKPTAAVWAVNQAARREPGDVRALVRAAERVRQDPAGAERDFRAALADVVRDAQRALKESGQAATDAVVRRIGTTAHAAAASAPDQLVHGVLREELQPSGFEAMAGMAPRPRRGPAKPKADDAVAKRERVAAARKVLAEARDEARALGRAADKAERAAAEARAAADRADEAVRRAEESLDAARG